MRLYKPRIAVLLSVLIAIYLTYSVSGFELSDIANLQFWIGLLLFFLYHFIASLLIILAASIDIGSMKERKSLSGLSASRGRRQLAAQIALLVFIAAAIAYGVAINVAFVFGSNLLLVMGIVFTAVSLLSACLALPMYLKKRDALAFSLLLGCLGLILLAMEQSTLFSFDIPSVAQGIEG